MFEKIYFLQPDGKKILPKKNFLLKTFKVVEKKSFYVVY